MIVFRPTAKLAKTAKLTIHRGVVASSGPALGDWFATLVRAGGRSYIIAISSVTLLPVVMRGNDSHNFAARFPAALADVLTALGVPALNITKECSYYNGPVLYAPTNDRSTLGVLVDFCSLFEYEIAAEGVPLTYVAQRLSSTPIVARNIFPGHATCALFGAPTPVDVLPWQWRQFGDR
jgi:hypothetical protein